jgi:CMP-N-acetylneuraminic acid synthetase
VILIITNLVSKVSIFWIGLINQVKKNVYAYIMDKKSSIDIDEELDFKLAEIILKEKFLK